MTETSDIAVAMPALPLKNPRRAQAGETHRAYAHDWREFRAWCFAAGCTALPASPDDIAAYLTAQASSHGASTLKRRLAAIGYHHRLGAHAWNPSHPAIRAAKRTIGGARGAAHHPRSAAAITPAALQALVLACQDDLAGVRDRALLLMGFAGALRRSELVGINHEHVRRTTGGLALLVRRGDGAGVELHIPRGAPGLVCPVRALESWIVRSEQEVGPVFRKVDRWGNVESERLGADAVRRILLRRAAMAGVTVPRSERLSPHGLRAGFVAEAHRAGTDEARIMDHTGHRDRKTLRGYARRAG